ncbi:hypothetical protein EDEG_03156 [Edhazardia aedis USNM 41457]|uniref:J domain-containing protein n=1 Tax=Edhazardia aedis (strain USNM 41457) TaxID=1003232 RepID=J9D4D4_EDHAE|nr:hypothetical protein EDEG_03156 [Edhazardia aedis USNM 41457]|eukprot:EJW02414.1 hypothetical protein EDEG_03156 [Edhazardia aedis USNM 41457]
MRSNMTSKKQSKGSLHDIMKIHSDFTDKQLEKQYYKLCMKYHPDRQKNGSEKYYEICNAYVFLKDKYNRNLYKNFGKWAYKMRSDPAKLYLFGRLLNKTNLIFIKIFILILLALFYSVPVVFTIKSFYMDVPLLFVLQVLVFAASILLCNILIYTIILIKNEIRTYIGYCLISFQVFLRIALINILSILLMLKFDFKIDIGPRYLMLPVYIFTIIVFIEELIALLMSGGLTKIYILKSLFTISTVCISTTIVGLMNLGVFYCVFIISCLACAYVLFVRNDIRLFGRITFASCLFLYSMGCLKSGLFFITFALKTGLVLAIIVTTLAAYLIILKSRDFIPKSNYFKYHCLEQKYDVFHDHVCININLLQNCEIFEV